MQVTTISVDLAKNVFQVHGITATEEVVFNKPLRRAQFLPFFAKLEPCLVGMESCSSAHHWARELTALGHEVRLIPPMYVKPYVKPARVATVAMANKTAHIVWAVLTRNEPYSPHAAA